MNAPGPRPARFGDLGLRVVSGLVLAAIAFANVWAGGAWAAAFLSLALVLMLWEYHRMVTGDGRAFAPALVVASVAGAVALVATTGWSAGHGLVWLAAGTFAVAVAAGRQAVWMTAGFLYMTLAMGALLVIRAKEPEGVFLILWMVLVVVATDVGAYFVGRAVGGAKLWPAVSPGKTRSGAIGGLAAAAATGLIFAMSMDWNPIRIGFLSVGISICAQAGDLLESAVKRRFDVKDASALIPGHGGVMDRLDGIMGGVWFFAICDALGVGVIGSYVRRRITILGSTGSVGCNTVSLVAAQGGRERFEVVALTGGANVALLAEQARQLGARVAVTADPALRPALAEALAGSGIRAEAGPEALCAAAAEPVDWGMSAIVGAAGLAPGLELARHGGVLALANKESLVCAGELLRRTCAAHGTRLLPVDSEHGALFQLLRDEPRGEVDRLILTASGGPFREWTLVRMATATPAEARAHPNWDMGERISIDSATMFNKALEVIEARALFDVRPDQISVLLHPQSVVHSLVEFVDGTILAHLGPSDMREAIGYALNWPERRPLPVERLDLARLGRLDFAPADEGRFPALRLAGEVLALGGLAGAVFNAAKEAALDAFIAGRIGFLDMAILVEHVLERLGPEAGRAGPDYDLAAVTALDAEGRHFGRLWVDAFRGK